MDPRDCSVIDRHFPRLQQCLEPTKLLRHLETVGVLDEDDVETIREEKTKTSRENQVAVFVGILKRREHGFRNFLQALLKSKVQDFLARELLEDDVYDEEEISSILAELENDLDETQSLKLSLIEEQKRHKNTKQELEEIRRSSLIFSDSSSSGLFADYDSAPSDENEFVDYSPREEIENGSSQDEGHSSLFGPMQDSFENSEPLTARNDDLEWEHEDGWRKFGSVDNLDTLSRRKSKRGSLLKLRKTSSLGRLNDCVRKKHDSEVRCRSGSGGKWSSEENLKQNNESSGSLNRRTREQPDKSISLENKVALLQKQLQEEHQKRLMSENEVAKLQIEKENLNEELEDTRDQLRLSYLNLYCQDDDYEDELYFDQADDPGDFTEPYNKTATLEGKMRFSPTHSDEAAACCSSPELLSQTERMKTTRLTESWRKVNSQFYELDEYDNEIEVELDPSNIMDALRRLKTYTNCLYNDILYERDELQCLKKRASRLENK